MKKFLVFGVLVSLLFMGCNFFHDDIVSDIKGTWNFPNQTIDSEFSTGIRLEIVDVEHFDLWWSVGATNNHYNFAGYMAENVFTGTFDNMNDNGDVVEDQSISITFTIENNTLKAEFEGLDPLDGVTLTGGVKQ